MHTQLATLVSRLGENAQVCKQTAEVDQLPSEYCKDLGNRGAVGGPRIRIRNVARKKSIVNRLLLNYPSIGTQVSKYTVKLHLLGYPTRKEASQSQSGGLPLRSKEPTSPVEAFFLGGWISKAGRNGFRRSTRY